MNPEPKKIIGGVGPLAGLDLAAKITANTRAGGDRDHLPFILTSLPEVIGDRSDYLLGRSKVNPANDLIAALAGEEELSRAYERCVAESDRGDFSIIDRIQQEHERQDARLNVAYKKLMESLDEGRKKQLREAQRAWIKFRDAYGDFLYDPDGGTLARVNANHWHMQATAGRARQLEDELRQLQ